MHNYTFRLLRYSALLLGQLICFHAFAGILKGKVTDAQGMPLPYATIFVQGGTIGVTANVKGVYELSLSPGTYKVICQYIGFKQVAYNVSFTGDETVEHDFSMQEQGLEMKEVVVHASAEDPAYNIIRHAIGRRQFHQAQQQSFQASIYLKGVGRSRKMPDKFMGKKVADPTDAVDSAGRGVLYLTEEYADYYSQGNKDKTIIHSVHESGNPGGLGLSQLPSVISFYDNNVDIFGSPSRGFISPVSDNALQYYKYKLLGEFSESGHTIYKIKVTQKRNYEPCFNGDIYIVDSDWAIHSLNMLLAKKSGMDIVDTMKIDQVFLPLQKDVWVIKSQVIYFTVNLMGFDITADAVTVYNDQQVNAPIPDSIFADKMTSVYDKNANKKDTSLWQASRPIPLEKDEQNNFVVRDSLYKKYTSPQYLDSMRKVGNRTKPISLLTGFAHSDSGYANTWSLYNTLLGINFNIVEGLNLSPKFSLQHRVDSESNLYMDAAVRYGFSNTHFNAIGRVYYVHRSKAFPARRWVYSLTGGKYVFQYDPDNPVLPLVNTGSTLFYRESDLKIYERWEETGYVSRNYGTGLSWFAQASYQVRLPLQNTTTYSFIPGGEGGFTSNTPPHLAQTATGWTKNDAALAYAGISYQPGHTYTKLPDYTVANSSTWPTFYLTYEKGIPGIINSVSNFDKWRFRVQGEFNLKLFGVLKYNEAIGGFLNSSYVSIPDLMHLYGNRGLGFASPYLQSFQFAQYYEFSNKDAFYNELHLEYHLNGLLSNKIPLLRQARWYFVVGANYFNGNNNDYYREAFAGIENIGYKLVRFGRIDFVQSWDSDHGHNSGLRIGINMKNMVVKRNNFVPSEW